MILDWGIWNQKDCAPTWWDDISFSYVSPADGEESFYPDILALSDYYPFGMQMPGRNYNSPDYRYGFQGQEKDDKIAGSGNSYTAEFWQYDSRLGRRWNVDPLAYDWQSTYATFNNNPIYFTDPLGLKGEGPGDGPPENPEEGDTYTHSFENGEHTFTYSEKLGWVGEEITFTGDNNSSWSGGYDHSFDFSTIFYNPSNEFSYIKESIEPGLVYQTGNNRGAQNGGVMTAGVDLGGFKDVFNIAAYLAGTSTTVNEFYRGHEFLKAFKNDNRRALNKAFPGRFKGLSTNTLSKFADYKVAKAVAKGFSKPLLGVGIALTAVDIYQNDFSASSIAWGTADTGIAIAAIAVSGPAAPFVAAGAAIYFTGRFAYGIYEAYNEGD